MKSGAMKVFFTLLGIYFLQTACVSTQKASDAVTIDQGIRGRVVEKSGNQMPSPDVPESEGKALKTTVYVYESTNVSQVEREGTSPFYRAIHTRLVKTVDSDSQGRFALELPAGEYSLFTKIGDRFYANSFDARNTIAPVTVTKGQVSEVNITVSATAAY